MTYKIIFKKDLSAQWDLTELIENVKSSEIITNGKIIRIETDDKIYYIPIDNIFEMIVS